MYKMLDNDSVKMVRSEKYNFNFNKKTGYFARWGITTEDDPQRSPFGPEIWDCEITTSCRGISAIGPCKFCYKGNTPKGENMSFETFKKTFDKFPKLLTQIAFGADATCTANPDMWKMMEYCRQNGVVPNITVAEISDKVADNLAKYCGAVAVSYYDKDTCFNSIKKLTDRGMTQINIHYMISQETYQTALDLIDFVKEDYRTQKLNAIVFLSLKQKGRGINFNPLDLDQFETIVDKAQAAKINYGFDSCGSSKFLKVAEKYENFKELEQMVEPCESGIFSFYTDVHGMYYPCSFCEGESEWKEGLDVTNCKNFMKDIWNNPKTLGFTDKLFKNNRNCPMFNV